MSSKVHENRVLFLIQDEPSGLFYTSGSTDLHLSKITNARMLEDFETARRVCTIKRNKISMYAQWDPEEMYGSWREFILFAQDRINYPNSGVIIKQYNLDPYAGVIVP